MSVLGHFTLPSTTGADRTAGGDCDSAGKAGTRAPIPAHIPRLTTLQRPEPCGCGGTETLICEDVTEVLDYVPARFRVLRHVRPGKFFSVEGTPPSQDNAAPPKASRIQHYVTPSTPPAQRVSALVGCCPKTPTHTMSAISLSPSRSCLNGVPRGAVIPDVVQALLSNSAIRSEQISCTTWPSSSTRWPSQASSSSLIR
ncbi:IS66 family transposase zinc-finger binding domain-containing protein [Novosphingobium aquae]|uniref:IS66 family transposase zinc-finger binding domain-containing protein n=1 Tax=Novosphingobium aquae TaxID=3133435 RepID=A0ABU8SBW0_9SPHN